VRTPRRDSCAAIGVGAGEEERERGGEVWIPISRWKSSDGSSSVSDSFSRSIFFSGTTETMLSSFASSFARLLLVVDARSRRAEVREETMGVTR